MKLYLFILVFILSCSIVIAENSVPEIFTTNMNITITQSTCTANTYTNITTNTTTCSTTYNPSTFRIKTESSEYIFHSDDDINDHYPVSILRSPKCESVIGVSNFTTALNELVDLNTKFGYYSNDTQKWQEKYTECYAVNMKQSEQLLQMSKYKNDSMLYESCSTDLTSCNSEKTTQLTLYSTCSTDLDKAKKDITMYAILSFIGGMVLYHLYVSNKSKSIRPPEFKRFDAA